MPELPEVEAARRWLERHALGRRIERIRVRDPRLLRGSSPPPAGRLAGRRVVSTLRHGKHLFAGIEGCGWLVFHFGMTGELETFSKGEEPRGRAVAAVIHLQGGRGVAFLDRRKLGRFGWVKDPQERIRSLGPDALAVKRGEFEGLVRARRGSVKALLMNQTALAGVGNLYADEILFQAGLHPRFPLAGMPALRRERLFGALKKVLAEAVRREAAGLERPGRWLLARRDRDRRCPLCGASLRTDRVAGRTSWYCPRHQPAPRARARARKREPSPGKGARSRAASLP